MRALDIYAIRMRDLRADARTAEITESAAGARMVRFAVSDRLLEHMKPCASPGHHTRPARRPLPEQHAGTTVYHDPDAAPAGRTGGRSLARAAPLGAQARTHGLSRPCPTSGTWWFVSHGWSPRWGLVWAFSQAARQTWPRQSMDAPDTERPCRAFLGDRCMALPDAAGTILAK
jgi:hypothetical protein